MKALFDDPKTKIEGFVILGDSLTDRGTMDKRYLLGIIPMSVLSGLHGKSPKGRFTDYYTWADILAAQEAESFAIAARKKKGEQSTEIGDDVITHRLKQSFTLTDSTEVKYHGAGFIETFAEGGLTAHNYKGSISINPILTFSRLILARLEDKRKALLDFDAKNKTTPAQKERKLVMEWSGANDLITVNKTPTEKEVTDAVQARLDNVRELIKNGYKNFVLSTLPDLSLTPRFQSAKKSDADRQNAQKMCELFNNKLRAGCEQIVKESVDPSVNVKIFDVADTLTKVYNDPQKYGFDPAKKHQPYTTSKDFTEKETLEKNSSEYMFWDDVHPTARMHAILAQHMSDFLQANFTIVAPKDKKELEKEAHTPPTTPEEVHQRWHAYDSNPELTDQIKRKTDRLSSTVNVCETTPASQVETFGDMEFEMIKSPATNLLNETADFSTVEITAADLVAQFKKAYTEKCNNSLLGNLFTLKGLNVNNPTLSLHDILEHAFAGNGPLNIYKAGRTGKIIVEELKWVVRDVHGAWVSPIQAVQEELDKLFGNNGPKPS